MRAAAAPLTALAGDLARSRDRLEPELGGGPDLTGEGLPVALWEGRAVADPEVPGRVELDGGVRVERIGPFGRPVSWRFAAGAAPESLAPLWQGKDRPAPPSRDWPGTLSAAAGALAARLQPALREFARSARAAGLEGRAVGRARVRARLVRRGGGRLTALLETGIRLRWLGPVPFNWSAADPDAAAGQPPPWSAALDAARRWPALAGRPDGEAPEYRGPAVLLPGAAAWWVHEMAHAAIEGARGAESGEAAIVDDPGVGPWPSGFAVDDAGRPARRVTLWGKGTGDPRSDLGRRRASVREPALPAPSCTRLQGPALREEEPLALGLPVLPTASKGRFDTLSGAVLLEVPVVASAGPAAGPRLGGPALVMIDAEEGWHGLTILGDGIPSPGRAASCTRQGQTHSVMVGAPTIMLDPVRILGRRRA